jgi:DNA-binding NarL/FixJ family response regulator
MKPVVTVVAGGQPMFLDLLSTWLAARVDLRVVAVAGDAHAAVAACVGHRPDLLVLEPTALAEDGRSVLAALADINPAASVVVLGDSQQPQSRGAVARVQEMAGRRLVIEVADMARGGEALERVVTRLLVTTDREARRPAPELVLSGREFDVFAWIGRGLQTSSIATELGISPQTVETHRKSITKKLRANGANLVRIAALYVASNGHREALAGR